MIYKKTLPLQSFFIGYVPFQQDIYAILLKGVYIR